MRGVGNTMLAVAVVTFWWLGFARRIDDVGVCGSGAPVAVAVGGYNTTTTPNADATVLADCQSVARQLTAQAAFPSAWLLWVGFYLRRSDRRYVLRERPPAP